MTRFVVLLLPLPPLLLLLLQEESINTLRYAQRAMRIENIAVKNEGPTAGPVSYAEVVSLRKEVKALQMALLRAQLHTISSSSSTSSSSSSSSGCSAIMSGDAVTELCSLRASTAQLCTQLSAAHSTAAAASERELTVSLRGDRWRQRCTELAAVARQLGGDVPDWAAALLNTTTDSSNSGSSSDGAVDDDDDSVSGDATAVAAGVDVPLVRAQHARIAALERELAEVKATAAAHAQQLQQHEDDAEYADSADLLLDSSYDAKAGGDGEGRDSVGSSSGGSGSSGGGAEQQQSKEELKRVDAEIQVSTTFTCAAYNLRVLCPCSSSCCCTGTTVDDKTLEWAYTIVEGSAAQRQHSERRLHKVHLIHLVCSTGTRSAVACGASHTAVCHPQLSLLLHHRLVLLLRTITSRAVVTINTS
jgi:hypothetical protein